MEKNLTTGMDFYKPTMSQHHYEHNPDVEVTFTFKNRGKQKLTEHIDPLELQDRFDTIQQNGWANHELDYLAGLKRKDDTHLFSDEYLDYIATQPLPNVKVGVDEDITIETTGDAPLVTFWETVVMAEVNEMYFENYMLKHSINPEELYEEGDRRLSEKIAILKANPDIQFSDFGTRRHFSYKWQHHVVNRLVEECPKNFVGTSNVAIAQETGQKPIGTHAHEMPMIYAGIARAKGEDVRKSHNKFFKDWRHTYDDNLDTALTDTFGSEFFFSDFTQEQAEEWSTLRHDSADPVEFGEKVIAFYEGKNIDPKEKTIVFSDGLDIQTIVKLHNLFKGRVNVMFGWGTTLTNDLGIKPLNIVMKATRVKIPETNQEADLVKLSDDKGKHNGPEDEVNLYQKIFHVGKRAVKQGVLVC